MNINQENRYLLPLLPYITVIIAWVLERINNKVIVALIGSLFVFQLVIVNSQSMGIIPINSRFSYWLYSLDRDPIYKDMLEEVADATCSITDQEKYNIIGVEFPWFNANSASFFSAKQLPEKKFRCYYTSLGYAEKNTEKAWQRLTDLKINYFITLQFSSNFQIDAFNQVSLPILQRIKNSPTFKLIPLVDYRSILLYKRYKSKTN